MTSLAVRVDKIGKRYRLGTAPTHHRLTELLAGVATLPTRLITRRSSPIPADDFWALRDVSFDVTRGETVGVVGRNGSGKSTLLKILSRITEPTAGRFGLCGRLGSLLEAGTGFHPDLTGRENVFLSGATLGMSRAEVRQQFDAIVAFAETSDFLDTPVKRYSSGMSVRLAFAIAVHSDPDILVLDEVLAVGDAAFQRKCLAKVADIRTRAGCTTLVVNHDLAALRGLCSRAIWLDHGRLLADGPAAEVISRYEAETGGGDVPTSDVGAELEPVPTTLPVSGPFTAELASHFVVRSGAWRAGPGRYHATPTGDGTLAVSVLLLDGPPPANLDIRITAMPAPGADGIWAVVLFDVESATRFRFAGRRPDGAWVVGRGRTVEAVADGPKTLTTDIWVQLRGNTVTVSDGDAVRLTHTIDRSGGAVGLGTDGSALFTSLSVRPADGVQHPPTFPLPEPS